jgi:hypothetical protein
VDATGHDSDVGTGVAMGAGIGSVMPGVGKVAGAVFSPLVKQLSSSPVVKAIVNLPESARRDAERRASRAGIYDPFGAPQRPFEADYPVVPKYDPATGRLLEDIEGRPLTARLIVGRRTKDGPDVALTSDEVRTVGRGARVEEYELVHPTDKDLRGNPAVTLLFHDPKTGKLVSAHVKTDWTKDIDDILRLDEHETGHVVDEIVLQIPIDGVEDELRLVYSALATGKWSPTPVRGPEYYNYPSDEVRNELMAEGIRAYMRDPNWFKSVAPNAATRIREKVNSNTEINGVVQFNSLGGAGIGAGLGAGVGAGAVLGAEEEKEPRRWGNEL